MRVANVGTPNAGRLYAMVTVAMYDAVNGIDVAQGDGRQHALGARYRRASERRPQCGRGRRSSHCLVDLVPTQTQYFDAALLAELAAATDSDMMAGREWGVRRETGRGTSLERRHPGRRDHPGCFRIGAYRADFDARFRNMRPFAIRSIAPYVSEPPPDITVSICDSL